jgi:hypothetical protein
MDSFPKKPEVITQVFLQADSVWHAWYRLRLLALSDGYLIEKSCGSTRGYGQMEAWFRWGREDAEKFYFKILNKKINPNRSRAYRINSASAQLELFSSRL